MSDQIRISGIVEDSIVDGPGLRLAIFTQGCPHQCPGCHNPQTHSFDGGSLRSVDEIKHMIMANPLCSGVSFSGGEPLAQPEPLAELAEFAQENKKNVWLYSGYTWEEILEMSEKHPAVERLIKSVDVLVDGRFVEAERNLNLIFRGSNNQRIINVPASFENPNHECVILQDYS